MEKKILFINPGYSMKDIYGDLAESGNQLPPQTLAGLAAITREKGYHTSIIDCPAMKITISELMEDVLKISPNYVGITSTTITMDNVGNIAREIKKILPAIKVVVGGPHVTALPEETLEKFPWIDICIIGEGDETLLEVLSFYDNNEGQIEDIDGIAFRDKNGKVIVTPRRNFIANLDTLPLPAWDILPPLNKFYTPPGDSINRMPAVGLVTSRGCPGKCIFCDNTTFGRKFRYYNTDYLLRMIRELVEVYGVKEIYFMDDYFMASKKRLIDICNALIDANFDLTWTCTGRISKAVDKELLSLMKRAGCWQICYGIESGSQEILNNIQKGIDLASVRECIEKTRRAGLAVKGFFMLGNFGETEETVKATIDIIIELPLTDFHMCYFVPFPGAEAYKTADKYGRFDKTWRNANLYVPKCFIPNGFTEERLSELFRECYKAHYFKPSVILYHAKKVKNLSVLKKLFVSFIAFIRFSFLARSKT